MSLPAEIACSNATVTEPLGGSGRSSRVMRRIAALLLVSITMLACEPIPPRTSPSRAPSESPSSAINPWSRYSQGWTEFPAPPQRRSGDAWVWTASELLVAGGCDPELVEDRCHETRSVYAFDPVVGSWRVVSSSIAPMADADALWTGEDAIFLETYGEH